MNHLLNLLDGFASILELDPSHGRRYVRPRGGFLRDQLQLRRDAIAVGGDIRKVVREYGEQSRSRTSYEQKR